MSELGMIEAGVQHTSLPPTLRPLSTSSGTVVVNSCPRHNPNAEVHFFDTGHFALETHAQEVATAIRDFLGRRLARIAA
jgi:hypothetical protein